MNKAYSRINNGKGWKNYPNDETPLNEQNLNKQDIALDEIDNRVITLDNTKATKVEVSPLFKEVSYDERTGIITFTRKNGATITIDTPMEKIQTGIYYNPDTEKLVFPLIDGTSMEVDLSRLMQFDEFIDSDTIAFSVKANGTVTAIVKEGSIEEKHLRPDYLADIKVEEAKAQASAANADTYSKKSQSYAVGGTGTRAGEDTDNSKYYARQAKESADKAQEIAGGDFIPKNEKGSANGVASLDASGKVPKTQLPDDIGSITGVKGSAEASYRIGNVNLTPANIGLENVDNTADSDKSVKHASAADRATNAVNADTVDGYHMSDYFSITAPIIPSGADLNTYLTPGVYVCQAAAVANTLSNAPPIGLGFKLIVKNLTGARFIVQIAESVGRAYYRTLTTDFVSISIWYPMGSMVGTYIQGTDIRSYKDKPGVWTLLSASHATAALHFPFPGVGGYFVVENVTHNTAVIKYYGYIGNVDYTRKACAHWYKNMSTGEEFWSEWDEGFSSKNGAFTNGNIATVGGSLVHISPYYARGDIPPNNIQSQYATIDYTQTKYLGNILTKIASVSGNISTEMVAYKNSSNDIPVALGVRNYTSSGARAYYTYNGVEQEVLHTGNSASVIIRNNAPINTNCVWMDKANKKVKIYIDGAWTVLT